MPQRPIGLINRHHRLCASVNALRNSSGKCKEPYNLATSS